MSIFTFLVTTFCGVVGLFLLQVEGVGIILAIAAAAACIIHELESLRRELRNKDT